VLEYPTDEIKNGFFGKISVETDEDGPNFHIIFINRSPSFNETDWIALIDQASQVA